MFQKKQGQQKLIKEQPFRIQQEHANKLCKEQAKHAQIELTAPAQTVFAETAAAETK